MLKKCDKVIVYVFAALLTLSLSTFFSSCRKGSGTQVSSEERNEIDSIVKICKTESELFDLEKKYEARSNSLGKAAVYRELGERSRNESRFDDANKYHMLELNIATNNNDTIEMVRALNNIATNYRRLGFVDIATEYHYQALGLTNMFSDSTSFLARKNRVRALNGLGNIFLSIDNNHLADSVFRLALKGEKELGSALGQAINYANIGSIFESNGDLDSAWVCYRNSMVMNEKAGSEVGISLCHDHYGSLYEKSGDYDSAIKEYKAAYDLSKKTNDVWHGLNSCISMARIYHLIGHDGDAFKYLQEAMSTAKEIKSLEHQIAVNKIYYEIYKNNGNDRLALHSFVVADELEDSMFSMKRISDIQNIRVNSERKRQLDRIEQTERRFYEEKVNKRVAWTVAAIVLLSSLSFIVWLLLALRARKKRNEMLQDIDEMRDNFFTNITHEFRTPLTVIQSVAEELKGASPDDIENVHEQASIIEFHERELLQMVNQLLDTARFRHSGDKVFKPWAHGDIVMFVKMIVDAYSPLASSHGLRLKHQTSQDHIYMDFVPDYMRKLIVNLISNSVKFAHPDTDIVIDTSVVDKSFKLTIKDHGVGISEKDMPHVFDPFYQAEHGRRTIGTGVGLAAVKMAVEQMGGTIDVESVINEGTTFDIVMPLTHGRGDYEQLSDNDMALNDVPSEFTHDSIPADTEASEGDVRVLIVEDSPDVAKYIGRSIPSGYAINYAFNGIEGFERARQLVPDIIITDIMMPGIDGLELCRRVRNDELISHIPVIIVTAKVTQQDRERGLEVGADAYLEKPFHADELQIRVRKLLEMRRMLRDKWAQTVIPSETNADGIVDEHEHEDIIAGVGEGSVNSPFVDKFTSHVYEQMDSGRVVVSDIAMQMFVTREQLGRKLKATTGMTSSQYVTMLRMSRAKRLLRDNPEMQMIEVALKCGINDVSYFTTLFKREVGTTPAQYRNDVATM